MLPFLRRRASLLRHNDPPEETEPLLASSSTSTPPSSPTTPSPFPTDPSPPHPHRPARPGDAYLVAGDRQRRPRKPSRTGSRPSLLGCAEEAAPPVPAAAAVTPASLADAEVPQPPQQPQSRRKQLRVRSRLLGSLLQSSSLRDEEEAKEEVAAAPPPPPPSAAAAARESAAAAGDGDGVAEAGEDSAPPPSPQLSAAAEVEAAAPVWSPQPPSSPVAALPEAARLPPAASPVCDVLAAQRTPRPPTGGVCGGRRSPVEQTGALDMCEGDLGEVIASACRQLGLQGQLILMCQGPAFAHGVCCTQGHLKIRLESFEVHHLAAPPCRLVPR